MIMILSVFKVTPPPTKNQMNYKTKKGADGVKEQFKKETDIPEHTPVRCCKQKTVASQILTGCGSSQQQDSQKDSTAELSGKEEDQKQPNKVRDKIVRRDQGECQGIQTF